MEEVEQRKPHMGGGMPYGGGPREEVLKRRSPAEGFMEGALHRSPREKLYRGALHGSKEYCRGGLMKGALQRSASEEPSRGALHRSIAVGSVRWGGGKGAADRTH